MGMKGFILRNEWSEMVIVDFVIKLFLWNGWYFWFIYVMFFIEVKWVKIKNIFYLCDMWFEIFVDKNSLIVCLK